MKKDFLGIQTEAYPHKIVRELVDYMLRVQKPLSISQLVTELARTNSMSNLRTRIKRSLTNTPDRIIDKDSEQFRKFSIPLHYKNVEVIENNDKYSLKLTEGSEPVIRDTGFSELDYKNYMNKVPSTIESSNKNSINVKEEFAEWLLKNAPESYNQYLGGSIPTIINRLNEIQTYFPEIDFFNTNEKEFKSLIDKILFALKKEERLKRPEFMEYDKLNSNGIPKAVIGKNNYCQFLIEYFSSEDEKTSINPQNQKLYDLKKQFLKEWPIERLKAMSLNEYTNLDKTSFCYWVESITTDLGSIWGGSSYKFGIFRRRDLEEREYKDGLQSDGVFAWYGKYGNSKEEVFGKLKSLILEIVFATQNDKIEKIDEIDLGDAYKWKIAFLFGNFNVINIFKKEMLKKSAQFLGYSRNDYKMSVLNRFILSKKGNADFFDFSKSLWKRFNTKTNHDEDEFRKRVENTDEGSLNIYFSILDKLIEDLKLESTDNLVFSTGSSQLSFQVGKRYCLNVKKDLFDFIAPENFESVEVIKTLFAKPDVASYVQSVSDTIVIKSYNSIKEAVQHEIDRNNHISPKEYDNKAFRKVAFDLDYRESFFNFDPIQIPNSKKSIEMNNFPLNQILYGPPGTGKTYNTVVRAAEIIENREIDSYDDALGIFKANLHDQIEFITFHQNYSYEDFIQGLRPDTENNDQLTFERQDGIFKIIADKALKNLRDSEKPQFVKRSFDGVFNQFINPLVEGEVGEIEVQMKKVSYFITAVSNKSIEFRKASGGSAHTLSIGTLKKMYDEESVLDIQGLASYYLPLLNSLLSIGKDNSVKKEVQRKNFVIIIDEINRANISRVFGELITLIEPDKRSHGAIPMEAKLPSGDSFIVPSNLYIIGTMNTADKSIALLDIALRRRFEFEPMYPKYSEDGLRINDEAVLKSINQSIIADKGYDFQIGHSYFMDSAEDPYDFKRRMNFKVIPLLLEYFMNDSKAVIQIISKAISDTKYSIDDKSWPLRITD